MTYINGWCVRINFENQSLVKEYLNLNYPFTLGSYYGITRDGLKDGKVIPPDENAREIFGKILTTEEFILMVKEQLYLDDYDIY